MAITQCRLCANLCKGLCMRRKHFSSRQPVQSVHNRCKCKTKRGSTCAEPVAKRLWWRSGGDWETSMSAFQVSDLHEVKVAPISPQRLTPLLTPAQAAHFDEALARAPLLFGGRTIWNVNSTATGGGVAEMLQSLVGYAVGAGVSTRWLVIEGDAGFFTITKRIHNHLHGSDGDGGALDQLARDHYEEVLRANASRLVELIAPGDLVMCHDPQTAGLVPLLREPDRRPVVWRCHVGIDTPNARCREAWDFLRGYVAQADACIFSRDAFVWDGLDRTRVAIIMPSIDPFATKNYDMDAGAVSAILAAAGLQDDGAASPASFAREDGSAAAVTHRAELVEDSRITPDTQVVLQVSRWDRLKDPLGVMDGFVRHVSHPGAHLVLAGPSVAGVTDDPEGLDTFNQVRNAWGVLAPATRERVHLATLPMFDVDENAVMVNALQRRAQVVVQKSLAEGFGLTVAEAMWKARPMVASRVGGIQDQIVDGVSGTLVEPTDLKSFAAGVDHYLNDPDDAHAAGERARERVCEHFLGSRHLMQYLDLLSGLLSRG
jgi:trehalose synthase